MFIVLFKKLYHLLKKENLTLILSYAFFLTIISSGLFYFFEIAENKGIKNYMDSLWWTIVTFTTVGYGDISPETTGGRVVAVFAMVFGIGFLGTFMATVTSVIIQAKEKEQRGLKKMKLKDHLIICGYNKTKVQRFIQEFRTDPHFKKIPIVIISNSIDVHPLPDLEKVHFVKGDTTDEETLYKAGITEATRVIVIAETFDNSADEKTILTVLLIEEINPAIYTSAEIISPNKKGLLKRAHCDEIISLADISVNLMVQAIQDPGMTRAVSELISSTTGEQRFHKSTVEKQFYQKPFYDLVMTLFKEEYIVFALERNGECLVNPLNSTLIEEGDYYFYISQSRKI